HVMVPPRPTPDLVMSQAGLPLGRFQCRFDPEPMGPRPDQLAQPDLRRCVAQGIVNPGVGLDGPHHDQALLRSDPSLMLSFDTSRHRLDFQGPLLAVAHHQADPAGCGLPCGPFLGTDEGDLTLPTDTGSTAPEPAIDQHGAPAGGGGEEDADLTVLDLAQSAAPLARDPTTRGPLLGEGAGIEDQDGRAIPPGPADLAPQLHQDRVIVPARRTDE